MYPLPAVVGSLSTLGHGHAFWFVLLGLAGTVVLVLLLGIWMVLKLNAHYRTKPRGLIGRE